MGVNEIFKEKGRKWILCAVAIVLALSVFTGCKTPTKALKIGVVGRFITDSVAFISFKSGMTDLGYAEGKDFKFIYEDVPELNDRSIDAGIKRLLEQDVDLLLVKENEVALRAKYLVEGTVTPVLFLGCPSPVESGLVQSLTHPGGNLTGVSFTGNIILKTIELLLTVKPDAKKVWLPYNPDDIIPIPDLSELEKTSSQLGIELAIHVIRSVEETVAAIEDLPEDIDAIFLIPSATLRESSDLSQAAISRGIPTVSSIQSDKAVLISFENDSFDAGKKAARLAQQIFQGVRPADLPVETAEVVLTVNLGTAEKIGVAMPDSVLVQAKTIIR